MNIPDIVKCLKPLILSETKMILNMLYEQNIINFYAEYYKIKENKCSLKIQFMFELFLYFHSETCKQCPKNLELLIKFDKIASFSDNLLKFHEKNLRKFFSWLHLLDFFLDLDHINNFTSYNILCEITFIIVKFLLKPDAEFVAERGTAPPLPKIGLPIFTFLVIYILISN